MKTLFPILVFHIFNNNNSTIMSNYDDSCDDCAGVMTVEELHTSNSLNDLPNLICSSCERDLVINRFVGDDVDILSVSDLSIEEDEDVNPLMVTCSEISIKNMNADVGHAIAVVYNTDDDDDLFQSIEEERINYYEELEIEQRVCLVCGNAINLICVPCLNRANQENNGDEYKDDEYNGDEYNDKYEDIYGDW